MSDKPEIPLDKVSPEKLSQIAGDYWRARTWISLTVSLIAVLGVLATYAQQYNQAQVVKQVVAEAAEQKVELRIERENRFKLEVELAQVKELLIEKDKEIADLQDEVEMLREELKQERSKFQAREAELIERISALKLKDGNPNSFE